MYPLQLVKVTVLKLSKKKELLWSPHKKYNLIFNNGPKNIPALGTRGQQITTNESILQNGLVAW